MAGNISWWLSWLLHCITTPIHPKLLEGKIEYRQDDEGTQSFIYKAFFMPCEIYPYFVVAIVQMGYLRPQGLICFGQGKL